MSVCLSCNHILTDDETVRKYDNWEKIKNPEDRYIGLCNKCLRQSDLNGYLEDEFIEVEEEELEDE